MKNILVTAALPYINNVPHMGHIVGSHLPADIYHRFNKLVGNNSTFVGGADAHGTPVLITAQEMGGINPEVLTEKLTNVHKRIYEKMAISYDLFSTTHTKIHEEITQNFYNEIKKNGYIKENSLTMHYCEKDKMFLPDRFVSGTCPNCGYENANGDECESCTRAFSPADLKNAVCKICGSHPILKESKHIFIDLEKVSPDLLKFIESKKDVWKNAIYSESKGWITEGLKNRCISRDIKWGIKINENGFTDKVFYVWFEAPIGYISITKQLSEDLYKNFWLEKNSNTEIVNFVGKDNIPFHCVFFPSMLLAHKQYNLAHNVAGMQFLNFEGKKFSKSKKVGVFCAGLLNENCKTDIDVLRAYLTTVIPENKDCDFTWDGFKQNTNTELANKLGNFFNRTLSMCKQYLQSEIDIDFDENGVLTPEEAEICDAIRKMPAEIAENYAKIDIREAYKKTMGFASVGNAFLEKTAPWVLNKEGKIDEIKRVMYLSLCLCKSLAICFSIIAPTKMNAFWKEQLLLSGKPNEDGKWADASKLNFPKKHTVGTPLPLFPRMDDKMLEEIKAELSEPFDLKTLF